MPFRKFRSTRYASLMKLIAFTFFALAGIAAASGLQLKDLPAAVQKTVQEQTKGAGIKSISKETEKGVTQYEIETIVNGKHRDFNVDTKGGLVVVEEETSIDSIPPAAKAAIEKKVTGGKLGVVETVTRGSTTFYEASFTTNTGKKRAILVKPDGTETKD
uniref:PepSY domain-containing protein n=1 Tax=Solibacter usitatus (strain Ellin6076) TaxID=234267 RepID=Q025C3_SOLUE